jgi:2'-5' RNA ligase
MTIKFLGDTDENQLAPLHDAMEHAVPPHLPLRIPLERIGVFPRVQQPTVLWVGPSEGWRHTEDASRLVALHQAVEAACQPFGFPPEGRTLSPHLTVARIKEGQRRVGQALRRSGVMDRLEVLDALPVRTIAMMKSELRPTGSLYTRVWDC